jgi:hypothetical protein
MKLVRNAFAVAQSLMAALFAIGGLVLMVAAAREGWGAATTGLDMQSAQGVIDAVGLLAAAVVALQIAQTIVEEEVVREMHVSGPTRVRRFLSRFLVVVVVALSVEGLVATIKALHEDMIHLFSAAALLLGTALLLAAWGVFVRLNRSAEDVEPEAMEQAKQEDEKMQ